MSTPSSHPDITFANWLTSIKMVLPHVNVNIDVPVHPNGVWFADLTIAGKHVVAQFHPDRGYGYTLLTEENVFDMTHKPEHVFKSPDVAATKIVAALSL